MTNFFKAAPDIRKKPRRMKRVSKKRVIINAKRAEFVAEKLGRDPFCDFKYRALIYVGADFPALLQMNAGCMLYATEVHEPLSRARKPGAETILDADNSLSACHACHFFAHTHPAMAEKMGLLKSSRGLT